jgi:hypothetical protein
VLRSIDDAKPDLIVITGDLYDRGENKNVANEFVAGAGPAQQLNSSRGSRRRSACSTSPATGSIGSRKDRWS